MATIAQHRLSGDAAMEAYQPDIPAWRSSTVEASAVYAQALWFAPD